MAGEATPPDDSSGEPPAVPDTFAFFSLEGDRFNAPGMPADAGREIAAYREALVEIATDLWKRANPDRRRVPNGFGEAFDLRLTAIGRGSAQPQLVLNRPTRGVSDEEWAEWVSFYERARDTATLGVSAVEAADDVPPEMSRSVRKALKRVGSTLDGEERIRLGAPASTAPRATVTPRVRRVLRRADEVVPNEPLPALAVGVLSEYNGEALSFILRTEDDRRVTCVLEHFNEPLAQRAREYLALDGVTAPDVRVEGQTLDDGRVRRIYNVHALEVVWTVAEKVVVHRLRALTKLGPGWLGPGSDAPSEDLAAHLEPLATTIASLGLQVAIVANSEGALVLEWRAGDIEYTAEVDAQLQMFMVADNVVTDDLVSREVAFDAEVLERFLTTGVME